MAPLDLNLDLGDLNTGPTYQIPELNQGPRNYNFTVGRGNSSAAGASPLPQNLGLWILGGCALLAALVLWPRK